MVNIKESLLHLKWLILLKKNRIKKFFVLFCIFSFSLFLVIGVYSQLKKDTEKHRLADTVIPLPPNIYGINNRDENWNNLTVRMWMLDLGTRYIRASLNWSGYQSSPTTNTPINLTGADGYLQSMTEVGMTPVVFITGAPFDVATYPGGPFDKVNNNTTYMVNFMSALASRYNGSTIVNGKTLPEIDYWEMYNEPDIISGGWGNTPALYAEMLMKVYPVIKAGNPKAKVIFGAAAEKVGIFNKDFVDQVLAWIYANKSNYPNNPGFDLLDLHFFPVYYYNWDNPTKNDYWLTAKINAHRALLSKYGMSQEIIVTETGRKNLQTDVKGEPPSEKAQGNWYWKANTQAKYSNIPIIILFSINDINDLPDGSGSWGILTRTFPKITLTPTPVVWGKKNDSYNIYRNSVTVLKPLTYYTRVETFIGMEAHVLSKTDGSPVTVFWSINPTSDANIRFAVTRGGQLSVYDVFGNRTVLTDTSGSGVITVTTKDPMYAEGLPVGVISTLIPATPTPTITPTKTPTPTQPISTSTPTQSTPLPPSPSFYSCNGCSSNFGCSRAYYQNRYPCTTPGWISTQRYEYDPICPRLSTVPQGGNNNACPTPTSTLTPSPTPTLLLSTPTPTNSASNPVLLEIPMQSGVKTDDATEDRNGKVTTLNGQTIAMGYYESASGFRFYSSNLAPIKGKTITSAYLLFQSSEAFTNKVNFNIYAQATNSCDTFSDSNFNLTTSRQKTSSVYWNIGNSSWSKWGTVQTSNLAAIVSEVTKNLSNWDGKSLCLFIINNGSDNWQDRNVYANEGTGIPAKLQITYQP
jgi:hypothetical protein